MNEDFKYRATISLRDAADLQIKILWGILGVFLTFCVFVTGLSAPEWFIAGQPSNWSSNTMFMALVTGLATGVSLGALFGVVWFNLLPELWDDWKVTRPKKTKQ